MTKKALWLATRDLRTSDNPALTAATLTEDTLCLFVLDEKLVKSARIGVNRLAFLFESLADLRKQLQQLGSELFIRYGNYESEVLTFAKAAGITEVHMTMDYSVYAKLRYARLKNLLAREKIILESHRGISIIEPGALSPHEGTFYKIFTPYYNNWIMLQRRPHLSPPEKITGDFHEDPGHIMDEAQLRHYLGEALAENTFLLDSPLGRERKKFLLHLSPNRALGGEQKALERLAYFIESRNVFLYQDKSNDLASDSTSRLSPYLHFGCISPLSSELAVLRAYADIYEKKNQPDTNESMKYGEKPPGTKYVDKDVAAASVKSFIRQLCWRDFYLQFANEFSGIATENYRNRPYEWNEDRHSLLAWMNGATGEDIVDAAMLQLQDEGFVHNRARLIASSYLSKTLKVDWRYGLSHYDSLLSDADFSSNAGNWQWMAGTGTDTRPNRTLNPKRQAERFDPNGSYRRRYLAKSSPSFDFPKEQKLF